MQFNNKFRIFGIIVGVLVLAGLVGVMVLTVQRAQQLTSTITRPMAAGTGACTGTTATDVGFCGGGGTCNGSNGQVDCSCGCPKKNNDGTYAPNCNKPATGNYSCQYTPIDTRCYTRVPADCGQFTSQSVCVSYPGCSWGGDSSGYTATSPIGGTQVSSLTPTFSWSGVPAGAAYQVICVGTNSSCNFPSCTADFGPSTTSYAMTSPLVANTQYYWMVYSQPGGNPAPTTGCQSFKTGAAAPECTADSACSADKKCESNKCVAIACTTADVCKTATIANHACVIANKADGTVCETGGKTCQSGVCTAPSCPSGQTLCSGTCKNLQTDSANCGACGTACTTGQACTSGSCVNNEANVCWGNGGTGTNAGRCYDCNGDGTVNILDFSCFRLNWLKPVQ